MDNKIRPGIVWVIVIAFMVHLSLKAQTTIQPRQMDYSYGGVLYNEEYTVQVDLQSSGYKLGYRKGTIKKYYLTKFYQLDFGHLKHPKEYKQSLRTQSILHNITSANGFIFGKQNSFFALRGGIGAKRYFSEKAKRKGISVALTYEGGPSLGITKPYYLDIRRYNGDRYFVKAEKYSEANREQFLDLNSIAGSASTLRGLTELNLIPGIQAKGAINFTFGEVEEYIKSLEAGLMIDLYARKIPIMIDAPNSAYFINFYLGIQLGRRK
ncbi:MAG: hypothetical protein SH818_07240 [Saprospiraceae bacterium]|nr:hypothetical protein [Saprospiraceae bacterium]